MNFPDMIRLVKYSNLLEAQIYPIAHESYAAFCAKHSREDGDGSYGKAVSCHHNGGGSAPTELLDSSNSPLRPCSL